jgi:hypothetical protein
MRAALLTIAALALGFAGGWFGRPAASAPQSAAPPDPHRAALDQLVEQYFSTWSQPDIDAYGRCFHPNARIWFEGGQSMPLGPFLESQRHAHASSPVPLREYPLEWDVLSRNGLAHAWVRWELDRGGRIERGYDFFTFIHENGRWQVLALVFNQEQ